MWNWKSCLCFITHHHAWINHSILLTVCVKIFQISILCLLAKKSWCALIFSSVKIVFINEKSIAVWVQSFMKTISNYFCVISPHEFRCIQNVYEFHRETQWNFKMSQNPLCITTCQVNKYFNGEGEGKKLTVRESMFFFKILPISGTTPWVSKPQ